MHTTVRPALRHDMLIRICAEYYEMPGLNLRRDQARRLWDLDESTCGELLDSLVESRFLHRRADGGYVRTGSGRD